MSRPFRISRRAADKTGVARRKRSIHSRTFRTILFAGAGLLAGVPISYLFQSGLVKTFVSFSSYTMRVYAAAPAAIWKQINSGSSAGASADPFGIIATLLLTVAVTATLSAMLGWKLSARR